MALARNSLIPAPEPRVRRRPTDTMNQMGPYGPMPVSGSYLFQFHATIEAISGFRPQDRGDVSIHFEAGTAGNHQGDGALLSYEALHASDPVELNRTLTWRESFKANKAVPQRFLKISLFRTTPSRNRSSQVHIGAGNFNVMQSLSIDPVTGQSPLVADWFPIHLKESSFDDYTVWVYVRLQATRIDDYNMPGNNVHANPGDPYAAGGALVPYAGQTQSQYELPSYGYGAPAAPAAPAWGTQQFGGAVAASSYGGLGGYQAAAPVYGGFGQAAAPTFTAATPAPAFGGYGQQFASAPAYGSTFAPASFPTASFGGYPAATMGGYGGFGSTGGQVFF